VNIIACVKQVPDTEAQIKVKADGSGIEDGQIKWVMNPYDEYGVEEALRLKEKKRRRSNSYFRGTGAGNGIDQNGFGNGRGQGRFIYAIPFWTAPMLLLRRQLWLRPLKDCPMILSLRTTRH